MKELTSNETFSGAFTQKAGRSPLLFNYNFYYKVYSTSTVVLRGQNDLCRTLLLDCILN
jgi:hypothetical protein